MPCGGGGGGGVSAPLLLGTGLGSFVGGLGGGGISGSLSLGTGLVGSGSGLAGTGTSCGLAGTGTGFGMSSRGVGSPHGSAVVVTGGGWKLRSLLAMAASNSNLPWLDSAATASKIASVVGSDAGREASSLGLCFLARAKSRSWSLTRLRAEDRVLVMVLLESSSASLWLAVFE
jgi:hypothetical protein